MIFIANGKTTGAFAAPGSGAYLGLVHEILVAPDPANTGYVSIKTGGVTVRTFNKPPTTGSQDEVWRICSGDGSNSIDPTLFTISQTVAGEGAFVTYIVV
jgi:hypothetical protein